MGRLVVVTGTGTEIGKTHVAVALVLAAAARGLRVTGYKPIESGLSGPESGDAHDLRVASTNPLDPSPLYGFAEPISPHLAAARTGARIDLHRIVEVVEPCRNDVDLIVVELAGGLFSPLSAEHDNCDLLAALAPDASVLVGRDALGVLHDVRAVRLAAGTKGVSLTDLVVVTPAVVDASTGTNLDALGSSFRSAHAVPRGTRAELAESAPIRALLAALV